MAERAQPPEAGRSVWPPPTAQAGRSSQRRGPGSDIYPGPAAHHDSHPSRGRSTDEALAGPRRVGHPRHLRRGRARRPHGPPRGPRRRRRPRVAPGHRPGRPGLLGRGRHRRGEHAAPGDRRGARARRGRDRREGHRGRGPARRRRRRPRAGAVDPRARRVRRDRRDVRRHPAARPPAGRPARVPRRCGSPLVDLPGFPAPSSRPPGRCGSARQVEAWGLRRPGSGRAGGPRGGGALRRAGSEANASVVLRRG
jgi:hypothetical protein